jgi:hypothetical protein
MLRRLDRRPHPLLIGAQLQPALDAGDLRIVKHEARAIGGLMDRGQLGARSNVVRHRR